MLGKNEKKVFNYLIVAMKSCAGRFGFTDLQKNADFGIEPPTITARQYVNYLDKLKSKGLIDLLPEAHFLVTDEGLRLAKLDPEDYPEYQAEIEDPDPDPEETEPDPEENHPPGNPDPDPKPDPDPDPDPAPDRDPAPKPEPVPVPVPVNPVYEFIKDVKAKKMRDFFFEFVSNFATKHDIKIVNDPEFLNAYEDYLDPDGHYLPFGEITTIKWKFGKKTLEHEFENRVPVFLNHEKSRLEIPVRLNERGLNI